MNICQTLRLSVNKDLLPAKDAGPHPLSTACPRVALSDTGKYCAETVVFSNIVSSWDILKGPEF